MAEKTGFSAEERAAIKDYAAEKRRTAGRSGKAAEKAAAEAQDFADRVAALGPEERALATRLTEIVDEAAPHLARKTWYGFPSWANEGKLVVFFKPGSKFKERYSTLGFTDAAQLDDGDLWAKEFALLAIGDAEAERIADLVRRAAG